MSITRTAPGTPATWSIGAAGQPQDHYPVRITERPRLSNQNGQLVEVVNVIALRKNLAGEEYTSERLLNTKFLKDRNTRCEALDGTKDAPKSIADLMAEHSTSVAQFQFDKASSLSVDALAALTD